MVKSLDSLYHAGRRGGAWRKVKPVITVDLVVLAADWGHGRREGWLSNLHLGARASDGSFVMVGKTFKGMTDELLTWQTGEFLARETSRSGITVKMRPELVVEIALDGVQRSSRYEGGVALRFARVKRYRQTSCRAMRPRSRSFGRCSQPLRVASRAAGISRARFIQRMIDLEPRQILSGPLCVFCGRDSPVDCCRTAHPASGPSSVRVGWTNAQGGRNAPHH